MYDFSTRLRFPLGQILFCVVIFVYSYGLLYFIHVYIYMYIYSREVFESLGKVEKYFPVIDTMDLVLLSITQLKCI